ncbi:hypothetical protein [Bartonella grahamii]|uniref:hypothetical protein n=1 Tax=Bartonella grahamii TaxID=33045 RepID=UPI002E7BC6B8|nr:hypothetical protein [Bartonella grahamii]
MLKVLYFNYYLFRISIQTAKYDTCALRQAAPREKNISVMGPAEAPLALVRGRYRFRLLLLFCFRDSILSDRGILFIRAGYRG